MRCIDARTWLVMVLTVLMSACASKRNINDGLSGETTTAEQAIHLEYKQAIDQMVEIEGSVEGAIEGGRLKDNARLLDVVTSLETIHAKKPMYPGPILNLGVGHWWLGDSKTAQSYFEKLVVLEEQLSLALSNKAIAPDLKDNISANLPSFTVPALNYLGKIHKEKGEFDSAEGYYRQALAIDSDNKVAIRNLAVLLDLYKGELSEALALYEQYQALLAEPDPQVKDWIFDLKNRL